MCHFTLALSSEDLGCTLLAPAGPRFCEIDIKPSRGDLGFDDVSNFLAESQFNDIADRRICIRAVAQARKFTAFRCSS